MYLERKISSQISDWIKNGKKALLIKGARQVGKTYLIRRLLEDAEINYVEVNLIKNPEAVKLIEKASSVDELVMGLSTITDKDFIRGKTIIFIDEIQKYKEMVTKIKFLVDEGSFRYILSGSLLGVEITSLESAPVGYMQSLEMFPLDFKEFLQITNITEQVYEHIYNCFNKRVPLSDIVHEKLMSLFLQYLVVGGMPDAVVKFSETHNINDVLNIHRSIIDMYKLDFTQYEQEDKKLVISNIYDLIPAELLKQNRRFIVTDIKKGLHFERIESSFLWLKSSGVALPVYNVTEPRIPLKLNEKQSLFKLYLSDVGLLTSIYGMNTKAMILNNDINLNGGGIYENAVAMSLTSKGYDVYYYNSRRLGELDFVIEYKGHALPIEVKSGKDYKIHLSLNNSIKNEEFNISEAFVFSSFNISRNGKITYLPVYMTAFLDENNSEALTAKQITFDDSEFHIRTVQ